MTEETVYYCEFLGMNEPRKVELPYSEALKRYNSKLEANKKYLFGALSFIGIMKKSGEWLINNDSEEY
jgi:hypothetical protein